MAEYARSAFERIRRSGMFREDADEVVRALQWRLEPIVDRVLSSRRSVRPAAEALAAFEPSDQQRFITSLEFIAETSAELAYHFCLFAPPALGFIDAGDWQAWVVRVLEIYDDRGVIASVAEMQRLTEQADAAPRPATGVDLERVSKVLEAVIHGLDGRGLRLERCDVPYTDTDTLYLPERMNRFQECGLNVQLYKATAVHLWAQTWFGTWRAEPSLATDACADPGRALRRFHALETLRLQACLARELPGLARTLTALDQAAGRPDIPHSWRGFAQRLRDPQATVQDSLQLLAAAYALDPGPAEACYQGVLRPELVEKARAHRLRRDRDALGLALGRLADAHRDPVDPRDQTPPRFGARRQPDRNHWQGFRIELTLNGRPISPPPGVRQRIDSILQDLGELPDEYLRAAGHGGYRRNERTGMAGANADEPQTCDHVYDEWDHQRQGYRKHWCLLHERAIISQDCGFVARTLRKHRGLLKHLHRTFEALRAQDKRLRRQPFGDEIDLDAMVEAYADRRCGLEADERLFTRNRKQERNIAVMFMVDMSGSTDGWINELEREALVLLCESLETLGDRYAIYGFSGHTHRCCELFLVKGFQEPYNDTVRARIGAIRAQDYTRMGAAIRHLSRLLAQLEARTKLLITLSDGRPDDQDGYRGEYGIEDTRKALIEARHLGIHPYCITIDDEALDYLPHMYGAVNFTVVDRIDRLPFKVSEIYRRLTL